MNIRQAFGLRLNLHQLFYRPATNLSIIDGLRSIAIISVVITHFTEMLKRFYPASTIQNLPYIIRVTNNWGGGGVYIFFVISGFLIGRILLLEYKKTGTIGFRHFYIRRFLRLMPVYWLGLLTLALLDQTNIQYIWANLIYVNNFVSHENMFLGWGWSLAVEEQFYIIFPAALLLFFSIKPLREHARILLISIFTLFISINFFLIHHYKIRDPYLTYDSIGSWQYFDVFYTKPYTAFVYIFAGVCLAYIEYFSPNKQSIIDSLKKNMKQHIILVFAMVFILLEFFDDGEIFGDINFLLFIRPPAFAVSVAYLIFYILNFKSLFSDIMKKFLSLPFFYVIAQLSYSMYIFHIIIIAIVYGVILSFFPKLNWWELMPIAMPIGMCIMFITSSLTYLFLERPIMNLRK